MNNINFTNPVPPKKQESVQRWLAFTCIVLIIIMGALACIAGYQLYTIFHLHQQKNQLHPQLKLITTEKQKITDLEATRNQHEKKLAALNSTTQSFKTVAHLLETLANLIPQDCALNKITYNLSLLELEGQALSTKSILSFQKQLTTASSCSPLLGTLSLASMQQSSQKFDGKHLVQFTLKGMLKP